MNTLASRLKQIQEGSTLAPCPVRMLLNKLDEETSTILTDLLNSKTISIREIHRELQKAGYRVARETLSEHRNKACRCKEPQ